MKVDVLNTAEGVEIHLDNADGSKTVWLCDTQQAALFKLASLLFSSKEDPKEAKRSILIGDFDRAEEEKAEPKHKTMAERAKLVAERLSKEGMVKKGSQPKGPEINEELLELLKQMKNTPPQPYSEEFLKPAIHIYPASMPLQPAIFPQIGDFPFDGTALQPFNQPYMAIDVNVCGAGDYASSAKPMMANAVLTDMAVGCTFNGNQKISYFKTSFGGNHG